METFAKESLNADVPDHPDSVGSRVPVPVLAAPQKPAESGRLVGLPRPAATGGAWLAGFLAILFTIAGCSPRQPAHAPAASPAPSPTPPPSSSDTTSLETWDK